MPTTAMAFGFIKNNLLLRRIIVGLYKTVVMSLFS